MNERSTVAAAVLGALIGAGLAVAGLQLKQGFLRGRSAERFVTVKGLAEREIKADTAIWTISFSAVSGELPAAYEKSETDKKKILSFLTAGGVEADEVEVGQLNVSDAQAQEYGTPRAGPRFIVNQAVRVHTKKVDGVAALSRQVAELVKSGVVLSQGSNVAYHFTGLNAIKPDLLAEATKNARAAAAQFAADSGATVGPIRRATQGAVSIVPLEEYAGGGYEGGFAGGVAQRITQKVRVVMTVEFSLAE